MPIKKLVSVVMPTYNEAGNVVPLIKEIKRLLSARYDIEFVVVDDSSPDGTAGVVRKMCDDSVKLIVRTSERGLASAVLAGIRKSSGDIIVLLDVDFSHPPEVIPSLVEGTAEHDIVFASRYVSGGDMLGNRLQYFLSKLLNHSIKLILGISVLDSTGGFFAARRRVFEGIDKEKIFSGYGDYCFHFIYAINGKGYSISEIPFVYQPRKYGKSKTRIFSYGSSYLFRAMKLRLCR